VEIEVQVETRGPDHLDDVLARLAADGLQATVG